jgi:phage baseplate assembly protein W
MTKTWRLENGDVALNISGRVEEIGGPKKVVQDLKSWLLNNRGYNKFAPNMGSDLDSYVGENVTEAMLHQIRSHVREHLQDYMESQMSDIRQRVEERGDPYIAIGLAEPSSLVKKWLEVSVDHIVGAIQINITFLTFTDDVEDVMIVLDQGIRDSNGLV